MDDERDDAAEEVRRLRYLIVWLVVVGAIVVVVVIGFRDAKDNAEDYGECIRRALSSGQELSVCD